MASHDNPTHPYGPRSYDLIGGDPDVMPNGYVVKGNVDSMLYHRPDSRSYAQTGAEVWFASDEAALAAGFALAGTHPADSVPVLDPMVEVGGGVSDVHPYGAGSHAPLADTREIPECYPIKGNVDSMLYHRPDSMNYGATVAEVWFDSPSAAEAAGFGLSSTHPRGSVAADFEPGGSGHPCSVAQVNSGRTTVIDGLGGAGGAGAVSGLLSRDDDAAIGSDDGSGIDVGGIAGRTAGAVGFGAEGMAAGSAVGRSATSAASGMVSGTQAAAGGTSGDENRRRSGGRWWLWWLLLAIVAILLFAWLFSS